MAAKPVNKLAEWADSSNGDNRLGGPFAGQPKKVSIPQVDSRTSSAIQGVGVDDAGFSWPLAKSG
ncbi:hypothetical protein [Nannocystis pusilla]|uniref:hypothetical protein n=1 Tax=Nannocystis pusilla TaxID=889268 RepID=UPI003BF02CDE